jgi:hypothetical protein
MYDFEEQNAKGKKYEEHFFKYLNEQQQHPKYNNFGGDNKDFDIEANGKTYEVKADFYDNDNIPIEICHAKIFFDKLVINEGWLLVTKADFIVFYKPVLLTRFYFNRKLLSEFIKNSYLDKKLQTTRNKSMITANFLYTIDELNEAGVIKKIEHFLE